MAIARILRMMALLATAFWQPVAASAAAFSVTRMASGLSEPWGLAFLPDGRFLVTERGGTMRLFAAEGGAGRPVRGLPRIAATGQGGLLDVMVPRDFAISRRVWLSYAAPAGQGAGTTAGFGRLSADGTRLEDFRAVMKPVGRSGGRHFGSRLVEARDGSVFVTTGERGRGPLAQRTDGPEGKVLHFTADGAPLTDPAFGADAWPGLHSIGHRNVQGAALDAQGRLWTVEHGAKGGDEVNRVTGGRNFGWPVISYGTDYDGSKLGIGTAKPGMEQPAHYWDPSIAPSGLVIYKGAMFPEWRGQFLTGSLKFDLISHLDPARGFAEERIKLPQTGRVRDLAEASDGALWFLSVSDGAVYRVFRD